MTGRSSPLPLIVTAAGIALYAVMDAVMKALALAIGAYSALFWRVACGLVLTGGAYLLSRPSLPTRRTIGVHAARGVVVAGMALCFFWGIARVPLAEAVGLSFVAPLLALALAALVLKERVGGGAMAASALGIAGVAVILAGRLGGTHGPDTARGMVAVLVSAVLYAINLVMARHQAQIARPLEIAFFQCLFVLVVLAIGLPALAVPPPVRWPAIVLAAGLATVSLLLLSWAYARAPASALIPVEYTAFVWAAITGRLFFGEALTAATCAGTVLIVAGCLSAARGHGAPALPEAEAAA